MKFLPELNQLFPSGSSRSYAEKLFTFIEQEFPHADSKISKVPDIRFRCNEKIFITIMKSCTLKLYLHRGGNYPKELKETTMTSNHTHEIKGGTTKQLLDTDEELIHKYIRESFSNRCS